MPILNSCCCCFTLRTGTLILGMLSLIGSVISTGCLILLLAYWETIVKEMKKEHPQQFDPELMDFFRIAVIVGLVICLIMVLISSLLIHGVRKARAGLMIPYMVTSAISLCLSILLNIVMMVKGGGIVSGLAGIIVGSALSIYYLIVIYSHYQEVRNFDGRVSVPTDSKF